jgi:hypothetical protein
LIISIVLVKADVAGWWQKVVLSRFGKVVMTLRYVWRDSQRLFIGNYFCGPVERPAPGPEGYLLRWIHERFGMKMDDFNIPALTGSDMIGRVSASRDEDHIEQVKAEDLSALLAWKGSGNLFDYLAEKYAGTSGISGMQPKVLASAHKETVDKGAND